MYQYAPTTTTDPTVSFFLADKVYWEAQPGFSLYFSLNALNVDFHDMKTKQTTTLTCMCYDTTSVNELLTMLRSTIPFYHHICSNPSVDDMGVQCSLTAQTIKIKASEMLVALRI